MLRHGRRFRLGRMRSLRSTSLRAALVPGLILLLFLAQGLRLCIPAESEPGHEDHAGVHLESVITSAADQHESQSHDGDVDLTLSALLKLFQINPQMFLLLAFVLLFLLMPSGGFGVRRDALRFRPPRGHRYTPPLRAPPR